MRETEVLVIGGGVIGTSITYHLAKRGKNVILVERSDLASECTEAADGVLINSTKYPGIHQKLYRESAKLFDNLSKELGYDIKYNKCGSLIIAENDEQMEVVEKYARRLKEKGIDVELLNADDTRRLEPALSQHIVGASYCPEDGIVDPSCLTIGFASAAKKHGAKIYTGTEVRSLRTKNGHITSVITDRGEIKTDTVVNAAGVWAPMIGKMVDVNIPIVPLRGTRIDTEPAPLIKRAIMTAAYLELKLEHLELILTSKTSEILDDFSVQREHECITISGGKDPAGYDEKTTIKRIKTLMQNATRIVPALNDIHFTKISVGLRPQTPDGIPILGTVAEVESFIIASGHSSDGIQLAPITGKLIAELIVNHKTSISLEELKLSRFR